MPSLYHLRQKIAEVNAVSRNKLYTKDVCFVIGTFLQKIAKNNILQV